MLIVLSPAKSLDLDTPPTTKLHTTPDFLDRSSAADRRAARYSPAEIGRADGPVRRAGRAERRPLCHLDPGHGATRARPIMAFNGDVYDGFDARTLKPKQLDYAQDACAHPVRPVRRAAPARPDPSAPAGDGHAPGQPRAARTCTPSGARRVTDALNRQRSPRNGADGAGQPGVGRILQVGQAEAADGAGDHAGVRGLEERQVQDHLVLRQAGARHDGALRGRKGHRRSGRS